MAAVRVAIVRLSVYNVSMSERPLHEPTFLMLTALAKGPQHGYGIITDVEPRWTGSSRKVSSRPTGTR